MSRTILARLRSRVMRREAPRIPANPTPASCRRKPLILERTFFPSSRFSFEALVGLVARRGTGRTAASWISATSRSSASARLRSWVRWLCATITSTPSLVRRLPASRISRIATSFGSEGERRTSKRSCTAVESLLTFCPPGPEERTKLSSISRSSRQMSSVMRIMRMPVDGMRMQRGLAARYCFASTLPSSTAGWSNASTPRDARR